MVGWLRAGAQIPDDPEMEIDLVSPQYGFSNQSKIQLEKKEDMKKRGLASPDLGDCLAMTFAVDVRVHERYREWWELLTRYRYRNELGATAGWSEGYAREFSTSLHLPA